MASMKDESGQRGMKGGAVNDLYAGLKNTSPNASDKSTTLGGASVNSEAVRNSTSKAAATLGPRVA